MTIGSSYSADARTRTSLNTAARTAMLAPALAITVVLFGGGLMLGLFQALGHLPSAGMDALTGRHFVNVLNDPDFMRSLGLTVYISLTSTIVAALISVAAVMALVSLSEKHRFIRFIFQIPLTVPHLVIAVAVVFLLAPTGMLARLAHAAGLITASSEFPLLVNDSFGIGIMATYIWKEVPFITLMVLPSLHNAGVELMEVGRTLKADRLQRFRYITLPIIFPSLGAASLIVFAYTFGAFEVPYLLGRTYPMLLPVWAYKNYSDVDLMARPEGIATGIVIALIVSAAILLSQAITRTARGKGVVL